MNGEGAKKICTFNPTRLTDQFHKLANKVEYTNYYLHN